MADTHITSGIVTVGSGLSAVGSGMNVITSVSGNLIQTSVSGNVLQTSISGNAISISGDILVTSFSGNVITVINTITTPVVSINFLQVTGASGGVQFPNAPVTASVFLGGFVPYSGGPQPNGSQFFIGGVGNNSPYYDATLTPQTNGIEVDQLIASSNPHAVTLGVTNLNQLSIVSIPSFSGTYIHYYAA